MDSSIKALIVKKLKDSDLNLEVGRHFIDETVVVRISGTVERHEDQWILPTVSIPLIPTIAYFWERLGVDKDAAMGVLLSFGAPKPATHRRPKPATMWVVLGGRIVLFGPVGKGRDQVVAV